MKKIAIIVVFLVIAVGAMAAYYFLEMKKELAIEEVLPDNIQLYMHFDNVSENVEQISAGPLWQSIANLDYNTLVQQGILNPEQVIAFQAVQAKLADPQIQMVLKKLFGAEFAVAVYPLNLNLSQVSEQSPLSTATFLDDALTNFMIVSRISPDVKLVEFFSGLFGDFGKSAKQETLVYKDFTIHSIVFGDSHFRVSYASIKDLLIVTLGERAAQKVIDVYLKELPSLTGEAKFVKAKAQGVADSEIAIYWDMGKFIGFVNDQAKVLATYIEKMRSDEEAQGVDPVAQINAALESVAGFEAFYVSGRLDSVNEFKFDMLMDPQKLSSQLAQYYTCEAVENQSLRFVPKDVLGYQWNGCVKWMTYWQQFMAEMEKTSPGGDEGEAAASVRGRVSAYESVIGLSLERDLLPALGDEFGGMLQDIQLGGVFPIPKFMLFVEVKDRKTIDGLLAKLNQNPMMMLQQENYNGIQINYFVAPVGGDDLQPSYSYIGDYLAIGINRGVIKSAIDAQKDPSLALAESADFKEIDRGLSGKNMNVFFARLGRFANKLEDLIEWTNGWAESQQRQRQALKAGSEQRLKIVEADLADHQQSIVELQAQVETITAHIEELKAQGVSTEASDEELKNTTTMIENKKQDVAAIEEQRNELEELIASYEDNGMSTQKRELFLNKLVYPLIRGLSSVETFGGRSTVRGDAFESNLLLKVQY